MNKIELEGYVIWREFVPGDECTCDVNDECTCGKSSPYYFEIPELPRKYFPEDGMFGSNLDAWEMDQFEPIARNPLKLKFRLTIWSLEKLDESMLNPPTKPTLQ